MKAPEAGNTAETLRATNVFDAVEQFKQTISPKEQARIDENVRNFEIEVAAQEAIDNDPLLSVQLESERVAEKTAAVAALLDADLEGEKVEYVAREEFDALLLRIENFNTRSGHHI